MGKYDALGQMLASSGLERVQLAFSELDKLCAIPLTAHSDRTFWANSWRRHCAHAWLNVGYVVDTVSLGNSVTFLHDPERAKDPGQGRRDSAPAKRAQIQRTGEKKVSVQTKREEQSVRDYPPLTVENIEKINQLAIESREYGGSFGLIRDVLRRFPKNTDRELVAMKVSLIDVVNSTNLGKHLNMITLDELTDLILSIRDFDVRVAQGDPELVVQMAKSNGKINLLSFATKYCTFHNADIYGHDDYSIFDRVVKEALPHYIPGLTVGKLEQYRENRDYNRFLACIENLLDENGVNVQNRRRKLDRFLWYPNRKKRAR